MFPPLAGRQAAQALRRFWRGADSCDGAEPSPPQEPCARPIRSRTGLTQVGLATIAAAVAISLLLVRQGDGLQQYTGAGQYGDHMTRLAAWQSWKAGTDADLLVRLRLADGSFPPLVHIVALAASPVLGAKAEEIQRVSVVWLLLLGLGVALVARAWSDRPSAGPIAFGIAVLLPATHAAGTRYGYELPLVAMSWLSWGGLATAGRSPSYWAAGTGVVFGLTCLTKWDGVPFLGGILLAEAIRTRRVAPALLCGATAATMMLGWFGGMADLGSLGSAAREMLAHVRGHEGTRGWLWPIGDMAAMGFERVRLLRPGLLAWYPLSFLTTVLSPAAGIALVAAAAPVVRRRPRALGPPAVAASTLLAFLVLCVPVLDERFMLVLLPTLAVLAALGLAERGTLLRGSILLGVLAVVCLDFHRSPTASWNRPFVLATVSPPIQGQSQKPVVARGLGLASSVEGRGWLRFDEQRDARSGRRDLIWSRVVEIPEVSSIGWPYMQPLVVPPFDDVWLVYEAQHLEWATGRRIEAHPIRGDLPGSLPDLLLTAAPSGSAHRFDPPLLAGDWSLLEMLRADDQDGLDVALWRRRNPGDPGLRSAGPPPSGGRPPATDTDADSGAWSEEPCR